MSIVHDNNNYKVVLIDDLSIKEHNYAIIHKEHNVIEASTQNLPQALTYAEQFNAILETSLYNTWSEAQVVGDTLLTPPRVGPKGVGDEGTD